MNQNLAAQFLSLFLSFALAFEPAAFASPQTPNAPSTNKPTIGSDQTQVGDGGGGKQPPRIPPVDYAGSGSSGENDSGKDNNSGKPIASRLNFGERYDVDKDGENIMYEGTTDKDGNVRIWRHSPNNFDMVWRGIVKPQNIYHTGDRKGLESMKWVVKWTDTMPFGEFYKTFSGYTGINNGDQDGKPGDAWGHDAQGKAIFYEGGRDDQGRIRVRKYSIGEYSDWMQLGSVYEIQGRSPLERSGKFAIKWDSTGYVRTYPINSSATPPPLPKGLVTGNLMESVKVSVKDANGKVSTQTVYHEGRTAPDGRPLMFRPEAKPNSNLLKSQVNADVIHEGVLNADNTVTWNKDTKTRAQLVKELNSLDLSTANVNAKSVDDFKSFRKNLDLLSQGISEPLPETVKPYHNYPAVEQPTAPIPKDHALVVVDGEPSRDTSDTNKSGNSETSSHLSEAFRQPVYEPTERPSNMENKLEWTTDKSSKLQKIVNDWIQNRKDTIQARAADNAENAKPSDMVNLANGSIMFYAALGVAAAFSLMVDYPHNPAAWTSFAQSLKSPVSWLVLNSFMVAAGPFYRFMGADGAQGMRQIPYFAAGLMAGALASTAVNKFARDEDVQKCLGFTAFPFTGRFDWDMSACDRAYDHWLTSGERADRLVEIYSAYLPTAASILTAGAIWGVTDLVSAAFLPSRAAMIATLRSIPVLKTPSEGAWSLVFDVGSVAMFFGAYYISTKVMHVEKYVREVLIKDFTLNANKIELPLLLVPGFQAIGFKALKVILWPGESMPAETLNQAEKQILTEYAKVKQSGWKNPYDWKHVCYDPERKYQLLYNCDDPYMLDFEGTVDRYSLFLNKWRAVQLADSLDTYKEWLTKLNDFETQVDVAHKFYADAIKRIRYNLGQPESKDPKYAFTSEYLNLTRHGTPTVSTNFWREDYSGVWKYVDTPQLNDYLLTSMACGPETEGYGSGAGLFEGARSFVRNWVTLNYSPGQVVSNVTGARIQFYPPRLTTPLPGTKSTICDHGPDMVQPTDIASHMRYSPAEFPAYNATKNYRGLTDYVKENIRSSILDGRASNFEPWWNENVMTEAKKIEPSLRADYKKFLDTDFKGALMNPKYECDVSPIKSGLDKYLRELKTKNEGCAPDAGHRVAYGVINSLRDEMRLYLAMLVDLYVSNPDTFNQKGVKPEDGAKAVREKTRLLMDIFEDLTAQLSNSDPKSRHAEQDFIKANAAWQDLGGLVLANLPAPQKSADLPLPPKPADINSPANQAFIKTVMENSTMTAFAQHTSIDPYQLKWAAKLLDKSSDLFGTYITYYKILTTFETADEK